MTRILALVGALTALLAIVEGLLAPLPARGSSVGQYRPRQCQYAKTYGMLGADCGRLELTEVPANINTDIQVLDLTFNRIRTLGNMSFLNYPYLRILYLDDNSIATIESGTFDNTPDLEVLDLTWNSLHAIPDALYKLPVLRKLLLAHNPFTSVAFAEKMPSIEYIDLSHCSLKELPALKPLPRLLTLNVSNNSIRNVNVQEIAPMCRLKELDLRGNPKLFTTEESWCECSVLVQWTAMRGINIQPKDPEICQKAEDSLYYKPDNSSCFNNDTILLFKASNEITRSCEVSVLEYGAGPIRIRNSVVWTLGVVTVCVILLVCFASIYFVRRRIRRNRENDDDSESITMRKSRS